MMSEEQIGHLWREMAKKEGHRSKFPKVMDREEKDDRYAFQVSPRTKELVKYLQDNPNRTSRQVGQDLGLNRHDANATLNRLIKSERVKRYKGGDGLWLYYA